MVYPILDTCDKLPALRFEKILKTGDYRYLLNTDKLPAYNQKRLLPIWDKLCSEYDAITNRNEFKRDFEDKAELLIDHNRLVGIQSAFTLMRMGMATSIEMLKYWDIHVKDISIDSLRQVRSYLLSENTRLNIEFWRDEEFRNADNKARTPMLQSMIQAENILKRSLGDKREITLTEWEYIKNEVEKYVSLLNKKKTDGRDY